MSRFKDLHFSRHSEFFRVDMEFRVVILPLYLETTVESQEIGSLWIIVVLYSLICMGKYEMVKQFLTQKETFAQI
jgi:hypothetical protein